MPAQPGIRRAIAQQYHRYHELAGVALVAITAHFGYGVLNQSAIPPYVEASGWTAQIGGIYAAWLVAETIAKTPMGAIADAVGMRIVYVVASTVGAISAFLWTITHVLGVIFAIRVADGFASAGAWTVTVLAMGGTVRSGARTGAMGLFTVTYLFALAFAPLIGGYANDVTGSKLTSFYVASIFLAAAAVFALFLVPVRPHMEESSQPGDTTLRRSLFGEIWLGIKTFPDYIAIAFVAFFSFGTLIPIVKLFAMQVLLMTETQYGLLVLPVAGIAVIAAIFAGKISGALGEAHTVHTGIALSAAAMWFVPFIHIAWQFGVLAALIGIGFAIGMPSWLALVSDLSRPEVRGSVIGAVGTGQGVGVLLGVLLGGYLYSIKPITIFGLTIAAHYAQFWISAITLSVCFLLTVIFVREATSGHRI